MDKNRKVLTTTFCYQRGTDPITSIIDNPETPLQTEKAFR